MSEFADLPAPEMGATTGFHRNEAGRQPSEESKDLIPAQLFA
jgi:hypothetical protein